MKSCRYRLSGTKLKLSSFKMQKNCCHILAESPLKGLPVFRGVQQCYIVSLGKLSGNLEGQIVHIDVEKEGSEDRSSRNAVFHTAKRALLAVTGSKGETSVLDKLHGHSDHVVIGRKAHRRQSSDRRPPCQTKLCAAVRSTNRPKKFSMFSLNRMI